MKDIFSGYYSLSDEELQSLWQECMFIVDTNVLLNLYRYQKDTSEELLAVLHKVADRLWIPFQVGLEYQENRLAVINDQVEIFNKVEKAIESGQGQLQQSIYQLQLFKRHSFIDPTGFLEQIQDAVTAFRQELERLRTRQPQILHPDKIRDEIDVLFEDRIGPPPSSQEELNAIYKEGEKRYAQRYPPGYMDRDKDKDLEKQGEGTAYLYGGLSFERKYGDLILWYQIIEEAQRNDKMKKIVYVSGDIKEDWWYKVDRSGTREEAIVGARPELVQEISDKAGVTIFHMYQPARFLLDAGKFLGISVSDTTVEQIRDIAQVGELTPREFEILELCEQGKTNSEISEILGISVQTVKNHCYSFYSKLDAGNRTEAVHKAKEMGLFSRHGLGIDDDIE